MIAQVLGRKLLLYVLYSAAVTALPVLASTPLAQPPVPLLRAECACSDANCCVVAPPVATPPPAMPTPPTATCQRRESRWWCRGPVRRAVRGVALFVSRPWRR